MCIIPFPNALRLLLFNGMNKTLRDYLLSSLITFISFFLLSIVAQLQAGVLSAENMSGSAVLTLVFTALRAAVKMGVEGAVKKV